MPKAIVTRKGNSLLIELPLVQNPQPSKTGKSIVVATTSGIQKTDLELNGHPVSIGVNAFYKTA